MTAHNQIICSLRIWGKPFNAFAATKNVLVSGAWRTIWFPKKMFSELEECRWPGIYPVVMVTVGTQLTLQPFPSTWFRFQIRASQNFNPVHPNMLFSKHFLCPPLLSLLALLFFVTLSWQAWWYVIHAQTTLTCVSLQWLTCYHRALWLAWFCLWLHRWWCGFWMKCQAVS